MQSQFNLVLEWLLFLVLVVGWSVLLIAVREIYDAAYRKGYDKGFTQSSCSQSLPPSMPRVAFLEGFTQWSCSQSLPPSMPGVAFVASSVITNNATIGADPLLQGDIPFVDLPITCGMGLPGKWTIESNASEKTNA